MKAKKALYPETAISTETEISNPAAIYTFKSEELTTLAHTLGKIAQRANHDSNNYKREIAITCAQAKVSKEVWKENNFTGIGDFANKLFGINKGTLSNWIAVANKFYLNPAFSENPVIAEIPINNLFEIAKIPDDRIHQLIESNEIIASTSQKALRAIEDREVPEEEKPVKAVIAKTYSGTVFVTHASTNPDVDCGNPYTKDFANITEPEIIEMIRSMSMLEISDIKLTGKEVKTATFTDIDGDSISYGVVVCSQDTSAKKTKAKGNTVTITLDELEALKAELAALKEAKAD